MGSKRLLLLGAVVGGALMLISATQAWLTLQLVSGAAPQPSLVATGQELNAALSPIGIAVVATAAALTIAGPIFRRALGAVLVLLGGGGAWLTLSATTDPVRAAAGRIAALTGLSGESQLEIVDSFAMSPWPIVSICAGVFTALLGLAVILLSGRWSAGSRKYETGSVRRAGARGAGSDRISDWDALSDGDDPTGEEPVAPEAADSSRED